MTPNPEQLNAIEYTQGPLIIIAGAGTGKTKVITEKILYLITNKNISPRNILALTFSNRAANQMQEKINSTCSAYYYDLEITTFHGFCNRIIHEYGSHIGISSDFMLLDTVGQILFLQKIYNKLNLKYFYNLSSPLSTLVGFSRFFSRAKDEMVSPDDFKLFVESKQNEYSNKKESLNEEEKTNNEIALMELQEQSYVYKIYEEELIKSGNMDFNALINYSLQLFQKRPHILNKYQERFQYILVDEFQDTNIAQIELLRLLSSKSRNITVVGDDDQSIYHFRGASYASFIRFSNLFPEAKKITLSQNYRSTKKILALANEVIKSNAESRFDPQKRLFTQNDDGEKITMISSGDFNDEAQSIVKKIKEIENTIPDNDKTWDKFAILYRAHNHKDKIIELLKRENIPFQVRGSKDIFSHPYVKDLVALLKIINTPDDNVSFFRILSLDIWNFSWDDKLYLNGLARKNEESIFLTIDKDERTRSVFHRIKELIGKLANDALNLNLWEIFSKIMEDLKIFSKNFLSTGHNPSNEIIKFEDSNVIEFLNIVTDFIETNSETKLADFIRYMDVYIELGASGSSDNAYEPRNAVQLMTIHAAKGLEFPYVFIISLVSRRFPAISKEDFLTFPEILMKEPLPQGDYHIQEERRLFYVALTRARKKLFLTYVNKKGTSPSVFIKDIKLLKLNDLIEENIISSSETKKINFNTLNYENDNDEIIARYNPVEFSYTQLESYITCPLKYKYRYIFRIPVLTNPVFEFGNIMHSTLEEYYTKIKNNMTVDWMELENIFNEKWLPQGFKNKLEIEKNKNIALEQLKKFHEKNSNLKINPIALEQKFEIEIDDSSKIVGRIDRIDALDENNSVEIIDYKTGKPKDQKYADKDIQLSIYAIACQEKFKFRPAILSFYYLANNQKISTTRDDNQLIDTKTKIRETICEIRQKNFAPCVSSFNCARCEYKNFCNYS